MAEPQIPQSFDKWDEFIKFDLLCKLSLDLEYHNYKIDSYEVIKKIQEIVFIKYYMVKKCPSVYFRDVRLIRNGCYYFYMNPQAGNMTRPQYFIPCEAFEMIAKIFHYQNDHLGAASLRNMLHDNFMILRDNEDELIKSINTTIIGCEHCTPLQDTMFDFNLNKDKQDRIYLYGNDCPSRPTEGNWQWSGEGRPVWLTDYSSGLDGSDQKVEAVSYDKIIKVTLDGNGKERKKETFSVGDMLFLWNDEPQNLPHMARAIGFYELCNNSDLKMVLFRWYFHPCERGGYNIKGEQSEQFQIPKIKYGLFDSTDFNVLRVDFILERSFFAEHSLQKQIDTRTLPVIRKYSSYASEFNELFKNKNSIMKFYHLGTYYHRNESIQINEEFLSYAHGKSKSAVYFTKEELQPTEEYSYQDSIDMMEI